jgi:hypothetical protein
VAGRSGQATIKGSLVNMRDGGFISEFDQHIAGLIANVVCGGDVDAGTLVDEAYLMSLERKAFCHLIAHPKTHERILGMLNTGKPVAQLCGKAQAGKRNRKAKEFGHETSTRRLYRCCHAHAHRSLAQGFFRNYRPDDLLATTLKAALAQVPGLDPKAIEDIVCGCAIPEAQQGLNVARIGAVLAGLPTSIGGITVNRFCASGLSAVAMAADRIRVGEADVMVAAGVESMSMVPMMGNAPSLSPSIFERDGDVGIAYGMGLTAEKVAQQWKVSREAQDAFALESHRRAIAAQQAGEFAAEITPIEVTDRTLNIATGEPWPARAP